MHDVMFWPMFVAGNEGSWGGGISLKNKSKSFLFKKRYCIVDSFGS